MYYMCIYINIYMGDGCVWNRLAHIKLRTTLSIQKLSGRDPNNAGPQDEMGIEMTDAFKKHHKYNKHPSVA